MNRREWLGVVGVGSVAVLGIGFGTGIGRSRMLAAWLRHRLSDFADLSDAPDRYADDFLEAYGSVVFEEDVVLNFLLSTDFFLGGEEPARRVSYVALYDPFVNPCMAPVPRRT